MVLKRFLKTIESEEKSFQVHRSFQTEERSKTGEKAGICTSGLPQAPSAPGHASLAPKAMLLLPWAPLDPLHTPLAPGCGQKMPATCFPRWIGAKRPVFFS